MTLGRTERAGLVQPRPCRLSVLGELLLAAPEVGQGWKNPPQAEQSPGLALLQGLQQVRALVPEHVEVLLAWQALALLAPGAAAAGHSPGVLLWPCCALVLWLWLCWPHRWPWGDHSGRGQQLMTLCVMVFPPQCCPRLEGTRSSLAQLPASHGVKSGHLCMAFPIFLSHPSWRKMIPLQPKKTSPKVGSGCLYPLPASGSS